MDEFTGIAVWLLISILAINVTIVWFGSQPTFADDSLGLNIPGITQNNTFASNDLNALKENYYSSQASSCNTITTNVADIPPCVYETLNGLFKPITQGLSTIGGFISDIWNFAFAWASVINSIFSTVPGGSLFAGIFNLIFGGIEIAAIVILLLKVVGIIRGGS